MVAVIAGIVTTVNGKRVTLTETMVLASVVVTFREIVETCVTVELLKTVVVVLALLELELLELVVVTLAGRVVGVIVETVLVEFSGAPPVTVACRLRRLAAEDDTGADEAELDADDEGGAEEEDELTGLDDVVGGSVVVTVTVAGGRVVVWNWVTVCV